MPVITIHALPPPDPKAVGRCLASATAALSAALQQDRRGTWAQWVDVRAMQVGAEPRTWRGHCPQVVIRARAGRHGAVLQAGLKATAEAIATALDLPLDDVWVHWVEIQPGRVFAGGGVR
jgi:hypothetical protein